MNEEQRTNGRTKSNKRPRTQNIRTGQAKLRKWRTAKVFTSRTEQAYEVEKREMSHLPVQHAGSDDIRSYSIYTREFLAARWGLPSQQTYQHSIYFEKNNRGPAMNSWNREKWRPPAMVIQRDQPLENREFPVRLCSRKRHISILEKSSPVKRTRQLF